MTLLTDPDDLSQGAVTTPGDLAVTSISGNDATLTGSASLPAASAGEYIELRDMVNSNNNGLYLVTGSPTTSAIDVTKQSLTGTVTAPTAETANASARVLGVSGDKNVYFDTSNLLWTLLNGFGPAAVDAVLSNDGVNGQTGYSFMKEEWKNDADLIKFPFPMTAITSEQFEFNEWKPVDESESTISTTDASNTRQLIRTAGWDEVDAAGFIEQQFFGWVTLGNIDAGDNAYGFFDSADAAADIIEAVFDGPVNEAVRSIERVDITSATSAVFTTTTLTRGAGSWITDGFKIGDSVFIQNANNSANDGSFVLTDVSATVLTIASGWTADTDDETTLLVAIDRRSNVFTPRIRVFGNTYDGSSTTDIGVSTLTNQVYRFPLSEAEDAVISSLVGGTGEPADVAALLTEITTPNSPYDVMEIEYFASAQSRSGFNSGSADFGIIVDADNTNATEDGGGSATAEQIYAFVQAQLQTDNDIDVGTAVTAGVIGRLAQELLAIASEGNTLSSIYQTSNPAGGGEGVYVDTFASADKNRVEFQDNSDVTQSFPLTVVITLNFNDNLTNDADAVFTMFFTNDDAGDDTGRDYGTIDAIIVEDDTNTDISGAVPGSSQTYNYAFDQNVQRGAASAGVAAPVTIVAIGLSTAQYVVATGTITNTGLTASLVAALERNFSNPT